VIWYRKSAAQGYAPALNQLGYMYQNPSHTTTCTQVTAISLLRGESQNTPDSYCRQS
jgi:TPR repeat protein